MKVYLIKNIHYYKIPKIYINLFNEISHIIFNISKEDKYILPKQV